MLRSADMAYVKINVNDDEIGSAIQTLASRFGKLHIVDVCDDTKSDIKRQKTWKQTISELSHMERKLEGYADLMEKYGVKLPAMHYTNPKDFEPIGTIPGQNRNMLEECRQYFSGKGGIDERDLDNHTRVISELNQTISILKEKLEVYRFAKEFAENNGYDTGGAGYQTEPLPPSRRGDIELGSAEEKKNIRAGFKIIWGTVPTYMKVQFKRMIARISRLTAIPYFCSEEIKVIDKASGQEVSKTAFYVVTIGKIIRKNFPRLAQYMNINLMEVSENPEELQKIIEATLTDIKEKKIVLRNTQSALRRTLRKFSSLSIRNSGTFSPVVMWQAALKQEKAILAAKTKCRWGKSFVEIAGWIPKADSHSLIELIEGELGARANVELMEDAPGSGGPPTYFPTNSFTGQFQSIVDTYGIPGYKEVNPGLFTIVTFPFLFGVMYGDIGHGLFIALFGFYLVINGPKHEELAKKKQLGEMLTMMHGARFVLFFMGCFGFYCGTIYNDLFSVPVNLFGSRWDGKGFWIGGKKGDVGGGAPYPYGVDPTWYGAKNQLQFMNSLKMKLSVILGVTQMIFGISLGSLNHMYERDYVGLFLEWIPRMAFMICTFGYMIGIIIYKWTIDWDNTTRAPPNLIQTMIKMFLSPGVVDADSELYPHQASVQLYLILIALVSVPIMLFAKPLITHYTSRARSHSEKADEKLTEMDQVVGENTGLISAGRGGGYGSIDDSQEDLPSHNEDNGEHAEHGFGDMMIHQGIHTIEFVLGCVSNTASYLRLWALSLAHAELSEVFWSKLVVGFGLEGGVGPVGMVFGFGAWFCATFAVLLCMDTMECVLHALRLHWVEFQNKFYRADGYKFVAIDFTSTAFLTGEA
ncbi:hypothetical protein AAMO2058_000029900 [Amorphochlora amoebiformis]